MRSFSNKRDQAHQTSDNNASHTAADLDGCALEGSDRAGSSGVDRLARRCEGRCACGTVACRDSTVRGTSRVGWGGGRGAGCQTNAWLAVGAGWRVGGCEVRCGDDG